MTLTKHLAGTHDSTGNLVVTDLPPTWLWGGQIWEGTTKCMVFERLEFV